MGVESRVKKNVKKQGATTYPVFNPGLAWKCQKERSKFYERLKTYQSDTLGMPVKI